MNPQPPPVPPPDDNLPPSSTPPPVPPPPEPGPLPPPVPGVPPAPPEYAPAAPAYDSPPQPPYQQQPPPYYGPPVVPPGSSAPSALKVIGIGCGVIALIAVVGLIWLVVWGYGKAKDFAENPDKIAEYVIKAQPDLEVVKTDKAAETVTIRNKATGEEMTMNFKDLREGRFIMKKPDGSTVELTPQGLKVTEADGTVTMAAGNAAPPPSWVPPYPRVTGDVLSSASTQNGETTGAMMFRTDDPFAVTMETYKAILDEAFSGTSFTQASVNGQERGEFSGTQNGPDGKTRKIEGIVMRAENQTTVTVKYSEKAE